MPERPDPVDGRWHGMAFGIPLVSSIALAGITPRGSAPDTATEIVLSVKRDVREQASVLPRNVVFDGAVGASTVRVEAGSHGFLFEHSFYGVFWVAADASRVLCAPESLTEWIWQRLLIGQILPLVAVLRGLEPFHGSAVQSPNGALILLGNSGMGKTSVMLALVRRGLRFLADDVTAVGPGTAHARAFPGAGVASVAPHELRAESQPSPWRELGRLEGEARVLMSDPSPSPVDVAAVAALSRTGEPGIKVQIGPVGSPVPTLLGATFNIFHRTPQRLTRQLEITSTLARTAHLLNVRAPTGASASDVADALVDHLAGVAA